MTKLKKRSLEGAIDHDEQKEGDRDQKQPDFTGEEEQEDSTLRNGKKNVLRVLRK